MKILKYQIISEISQTPIKIFLQHFEQKSVYLLKFNIATLI